MGLVRRGASLREFVPGVGRACSCRFARRCLRREKNFLRPIRACVPSVKEPSALVVRSPESLRVSVGGGQRRRGMSSSSAIDRSDGLDFAISDVSLDFPEAVDQMNSVTRDAVVHETD